MQEITAPQSDAQTKATVFILSVIYNLNER